MNEETRKLRDSEAEKYTKKFKGIVQPDGSEGDPCLIDLQIAYEKGFDAGYAQAKREAQGEIDELRDLAAGNMCGYCDHKLNSGYDLQSQLSEERARGEKLREALKFYHRTSTWEAYGTIALEDSGVTASEALASYEGGSK